MNLSLSLVIAVGMSALSSTTYAQTVVTNLNDSGPGSLRNAIDISSSGDHISFSITFNGANSDTLHLDSVITIDKALTFQGIMTSTDTLYISGGGTHGIFKATNVDSLEFSDLAFIDAKLIDDGGAAISVMNADYVSIENCFFTRNESTGVFNSITSPNGGAVNLRMNMNGIAEVKDCHFIDNQASRAAGALNLSESTSLISGCSFEGNEANAGGAIRAINGGGVTVSHCEFVNNIASNPSFGVVGGAMSIQAVDLHVDSSTFRGNHVNPMGSSSGSLNFGGAIFCQSDVMEVNACLFEDNTAIRYGGAVYFSGENGEVKGSSFSNNSSGVWGGALFFQAVSNSVDSYLQGNTFYQNESSEGGALFLSQPGYPQASVFLTNTTFFDNSSTNPTYDQPHSVDVEGGNLVLEGCVISLADTNQYQLYQRTTIYLSPAVTLVNNGYNAFSNSGILFTPASTDRMNQSAATLDFSSFGSAGTYLPLLVPRVNSDLINHGNPQELSDAQNGSIINIREIGAAEYRNYSWDTTYLCSEYVWNNDTLSSAGFYSDTLYYAGGVDSVQFLTLLDFTPQIDSSASLAVINPLSSVNYSWLNCDSISNGVIATGVSFQPLVGGSYAVVAEVNGCSDTSDCQSWSGLSLEEAAQVGFIIYPNPAEDRLYIASDGFGTFDWEIIDLYGRTIRLGKAQENIAVDLTNVLAGVYVVRLVHDNRTYSSRLIIK